MSQMTQIPVLLLTANSCLLTKQGYPQITQIAQIPVHTVHGVRRPDYRGEPQMTQIQDKGS
jgi:hypothetical protein